MKSSCNILYSSGKPWVIHPSGQQPVCFNYNLVGDNTKVYSSVADDWERNYTYDRLGRRLTYTEGELAEYLTYDGSNLATHTQRWLENGQPRTKTTQYHYNAHRLDSVGYDDALTTIYHYDKYGRVDSLYDESGVVCYTYGNMGEVTNETRIYALPFLSQPIALTTQFTYDSWGRIQSITYPDNEVVSYAYDLGGQLQSISNNSSYTYLDNVTYDKFGAKISQEYGNGIVTDYDYDNINRRLTNIFTSNGTSISYTYDLVGNVTQVNSNYPWLQNSGCNETFTYDASDQLVAAVEQGGGYSLAVTYGNWGKVNTYDLTQTDRLQNISTQNAYTFTYPTDPNNPQQAQTMFAPAAQLGGTGGMQVVTAQYTFGINGSLRKKEHLTHNNPVEYYLFNSAANMKAYSNNLTDFAYYGYNAANTRTYKLSMLNMNQWVNGQLVSLLFLCSPKESLRQASKKELVRFLEREQTSPKVTEQKERAFAAVEKNPVHNARQLAERRYPLRSHPSCLRPGFPSFGEIQTSLYSALTIGKRSAPLPCYGRRIFFITPQVCDMTLTTRENQGLQQWQDATLSSEVPPCNLLFSIAYGQVCLRSAKMMQASLLHSLRANSLCFVSFFFSGRRKKERNEGKNFYYHTNHLGSTAFVTDQNQNVTQGFLYAPFGEITTEYAPSWQNGTLPKYSFNAKELDEETGMYYYEARYYKPPVFTSRDPMFEKKPWSSPYVYCKNNPIIMIDPDGRDEYEVDLVNKTVSTVKGTEGTPDKFTVIDKDGNRISSNSYKNGTIKKFDSKSAASFEIDGDAAGKELFEFLADNTGVEWACLATGEDANGTNYLLTDFDENKVNVNTEHMGNKYIRIYNHNHTNPSITYPSDEDLHLIKGLQYRNLRIKYPPYMWPLTSDNEETICTPVSNIYVNKRYVSYTPKPKSLYRDPILESSPSVKTPIPLP